MSPKAKLTVGLLAIAVFSGTALALVVERYPPRSENAGVAQIRAESRLTGRQLFIQHQCVTCHGVDGGGTEMGPGLGSVMPEYLAGAGGDEAAALEDLVAYLLDPKGRPKLRRDTTRYPNPMPSAKGLGIEEEGLRKIAAHILHLKPQAQAVGGDGGKR